MTKFTHSQDNSDLTGDMAIRCSNCNNVRFTRNHFEMTTSTTCPDGSTFCTATKSSWLGFSGGGTNNRVDHNDFLNKRTHDVFLLFLGGGFHSTIDHNYFARNDVYIANGGECFRVGNSGVQTDGSNNGASLVEYFLRVKTNLFEECNGDREAITVKGSSNVFRHNTFRNNEGSLVLRHGDNNTVDKNFFVGGLQGIRAYGRDHNITNNYIVSNTGTGIRGAIVIGSGCVENDGLTSQSCLYSRPRNILVAFNTLYQNSDHLTVGQDYGTAAGPDPLTLEPLQIRIDHNIVVGSSGQLTDYLSPQSGMTQAGNILWGTGSNGDMPSAGFTRMDPLISLAADGVYRIASTSPAINRANAAPYPQYVSFRDFEGHNRAGLLDTGADEYSTGIIRWHPIIRSEVGAFGPDLIGNEDPLD